MSSGPVRKMIKAGDCSRHPFNQAFTDQERRVFQLIEQLRTTLGVLKTELAKTTVHACQPPEKYKPKEMEEIQAIEEGLDSLDLDLRWIPGGAHRYE